MEEKMLEQQDGQVVVWESIAADIILIMSITAKSEKEKYGQVQGSNVLPMILFEILDTFKKMPSPCGATVSHL